MNLLMQSVYLIGPNTSNLNTKLAVAIKANHKIKFYFILFNSHSHGVQIAEIST